MNTTTAATQAGVTTPTIRHWCRFGVVAAIKSAGRWIIDAASLARRIAIGKEYRMDTPPFEIKESVTKYGSTKYTVVRADETRDWRIGDASYTNREHAEVHAEFLNRTPSEYRINQGQYPARSIRSGARFWKISGGRNGDPLDFNHTWDDGEEVKGDWPEGTTPVDILVHFALQHAAGADGRIAKKAAADAVASAEAAVRDARQAQLDDIASRRGALATERQVDYILQLLAAREISGEGGGFFIGPKTRAGIEELTKVEASNYITSLKGDY